MAKQKQERAAIIPYYIDENQTIRMLFMKPSDPRFGGKAYQLAKGKIDPGENHKQAALREGREELGLFSGNISDLQRLGSFLGYTTVFIAEIKDLNMFGDSDYETESVKWMDEKTFLADGRPLHKSIVQAAVRKIKQLKGIK